LAGNRVPDAMPDSGQFAGTEVAERHDEMQKSIFTSQLSDTKITASAGSKLV